MAATQLALGQADQAPTVIRDADITATDALGRTLPTFSQTDSPKDGRWVGLFYWLWHGDDRFGKDYNFTDYLKAHPGIRYFTPSLDGGPMNPALYWAEPLFGYYRSTDPWVIRKHLALLAHAGIDFLYLDYTNAVVYDQELATFLKVAEELKSEGMAVPRLVFFLHTTPDAQIESLYTKWYKPGHYDDMWFRWHSKPLIMCTPPDPGATDFQNPWLIREVTNYFTWRPAWVFTHNKTMWKFEDSLRPDLREGPAIGPDKKPEQIVVSKSLGGPIFEHMESGGVSTYPGHVPTYNDQWLSGEEAKGLFFQYSWDQALAHPAPILLVTGWNEWKAGIWETPGVPMLGKVTGKGQGNVIDEFNMDFNRDLEPMRGGYGDDYYWQFLANVRLYKGMEPPQPVSRPKSIQVDGPLDQWNDVTPVYKDIKGLPLQRDWPGTIPGTHYTDQSTRNEVVFAQVARDRRTLTFRAHTASPITAPSGRSWMLLLIDADNDAKTGWNGYDLLINRDRVGDQCTIEENVGGGWNWKPVGMATLAYHGQDLVISVPLSIVKALAPHGALTFGFKWADNLPETPSVFDFYTKGDVAPEARFNFSYAVPPPPAADWPFPPKLNGEARQSVRG